MSAVQIIKPRVSLTAKVGRIPTFDPAALARAEAALNDLSPQFDAWMAIEVEKLADAMKSARDEAWSDSAVAGLYTRAHDIKGLATTYKFPLASHLAGSLTQLLEADRARLDAKAFERLAIAHVEAIRAVVRDFVRDVQHPVGSMLLQELAQQTRELLDQAR